eukprot:795928-Amphidinium_carterae.1
MCLTACALVERLVATNTQTGEQTQSKIMLCDLAGSERSLALAAKSYACKNPIYPLHSPQAHHNFLAFDTLALSCSQNLKLSFLE